MATASTTTDTSSASTPDVAQDGPDAVPATDVAAPPAEAPDAPPVPEPDPVEDDPAAASLNRKLIDWLNGHIAGGPIARNTDCWNALYAALPALRASLLKGD